MANSRKPGPLQSPSGMWMIPARTPGPMGMFDQGDPNVTTALGDTPGPLGHNDANDPSISIFGPALGVPRRLSSLAELNAGSRVRAMSQGEAFFTFHPVGRALHGYAESALAITRSPLTLAEGVGNLLNDAYGYSKDLVAGPKTGVMGDARPYSAASGLLQSIQRDGWLGTTGNIVRGTILSLPGIAQIDAINRRDPHAFGASLPATFLALSGRMAAGQGSAIRSGGTIAKAAKSEVALVKSASNASGTRTGPIAALEPEGKPKGSAPEIIARANSARTINFGNVPESITTSSGIPIQPTPGVTTTILGSYEKDMNNIINREIKYPKMTDFGAKPGGFNVLNVPDEMYQSPNQFWNEVNEPFLDAAIKRGDEIPLATKPTVDVLYRDDGSLTGFGKEIQHLTQNGYHYNAATGKMVPN